jgi:SRSO17 transposase
MTPTQMRKLDAELREYFESMVEGMGRLERRRALELYLSGLLLDGERKSVESMAGRLVEEARQREALRQRLQQCVSVADWGDDEMRRRLALKLEAKLPQLEALVVDDTGFPKKGEHSAGVAHQYSGTLVLQLHFDSRIDAAVMAQLGDGLVPPPPATPPQH